VGPLLERFAEVSQAPYEVLGAPRVGIDSAADDWLQEQLRAQGVEDRFDEVRAGNHGFYVLSLLGHSAGLPYYGSGGYDGVDAYTFRGEFLRVAADVLGEALLERAWERMTPAELAAYGEALLAVARPYAAAHGVAHLEAQEHPPEDFDEADPAVKAHILFAAAAWCRFWSDLGFGLEPYW
jgi:hypothetical protein